jgi:formylglycine-generating enzyme required for sulfatase activity
VKPLALFIGIIAAAACAGSPHRPAPDRLPASSLELPAAAPSSTAAPVSKPAGPPASASLGEIWRRPDDGAAMVYVPGGEFGLGSDAAALERARRLCIEYSTDPAAARATCSHDAFEDEHPAHRVTLDGFWIDRTEVTNGRYRRCVESGACTPPAESGSYTRASYYGNPLYDDYPVIWVTWGQAAGYCAWAGGRLPTEAEWEAAARGPQGRTYPWGDAFDGTRLNYCDARCPAGPNDVAVDDGYADTAPAGSFPDGASWCGALDLAGNVREWVGDWYGKYPAALQSNPAGPPSGESRIPRGGSWLDLPDDIRSANRGANAPDYTRHKVGFRCAAADGNE